MITETLLKILVLFHLLVKSYALGSDIEYPDRGPDIIDYRDATNIRRNDNLTWVATTTPTTLPPLHFKPPVDHNMYKDYMKSFNHDNYNINKRARTYEGFGEGMVGPPPEYYGNGGHNKDPIHEYYDMYPPQGAAQGNPYGRPGPPHEQGYVLPEHRGANKELPENSGTNNEEFGNPGPDNEQYGYGMPRNPEVGYPGPGMGYGPNRPQMPGLKPKPPDFNMYAPQMPRNVERSLPGRPGNFGNRPGSVGNRPRINDRFEKFWTGPALQNGPGPPGNFGNRPNIPGNLGNQPGMSGNFGNRPDNYKNQELEYIQNRQTNAVGYPPYNFPVFNTNRLKASTVRYPEQVNIQRNDAQKVSPGESLGQFAYGYSQRGNLDPNTEQRPQQYQNTAVEAGQQDMGAINQGPVHQPKRNENNLITVTGPINQEQKAVQVAIPNEDYEKAENQNVVEYQDHVNKNENQSNKQDHIIQNKYSQAQNENKTTDIQNSNLYKGLNVHQTTQQQNNPNPQNPQPQNNGAKMQVSKLHDQNLNQSPKLQNASHLQIFQNRSEGIKLQYLEEEPKPQDSSEKENKNLQIDHNINETSKIETPYLQEVTKSQNVTSDIHILNLELNHNQLHDTENLTQQENKNQATEIGNVNQTTEIQNTNLEESKKQHDQILKKNFNLMEKDDNLNQNTVTLDGYKQQNIPSVNQGPAIQNNTVSKEENQIPVIQNNPNIKKTAIKRNPQNLEPDNVEAENLEDEPKPTQPSSQEPKKTGTPVKIGDFDYHLIPGWDELGFHTVPGMTTLPRRNNTSQSETVLAGEGYTQKAMHPIVAEVKQQMTTHNQGYFTAFTAKLFQMLQEKPAAHALELFVSLNTVIENKTAKGELAYMGQPAVKALSHGMLYLVNWGPSKIQAMLPTATAMLYGKNIALSKDLLTVLNIIDAAYNLEEGDELLETLEHINGFPDHIHTSSEVATNVMEAILQPFERTAGTPESKQLFNLLNLLLINKYKFTATRRGEDTNVRRVEKDEVKGDGPVVVDDEEVGDTKNGNKTDEAENENLIRDETALNSEENRIKDGQIAAKDVFDKRHREKTQHRIEKARIHAEFRTSPANRTLANNKQERNEEMRDSGTNKKNKMKHEDNIMTSEEIHSKLNQLKAKGLSTKTDRDYTFEKPLKISGDKIKKIKELIKNHFKYKHPYLYRQKNTLVKKNSFQNTKRPAHRLKIPHGHYERLKEKDYTYEKTLKKTYRDIYKFDDIKSMNKKREERRTVVHKELKEKHEAATRMYQKRFNVITSAPEFQTTNKRETDRSYEQKTNEKKMVLQQQASVTHDTKDKSKYLAPIVRPRNDYRNAIARAKTKEETKVKSIVNSIREESSYSDDERELKFVLSDAVRHSGLVFNNLRYNDPIKDGAELNELTSETDEEGVFKTNIYKAFGYDPDLSVRN